MIKNEVGGKKLEVDELISSLVILFLVLCSLAATAYGLQLEACSGFR
jgi:hypothetical protein